MERKLKRTPDGHIHGHPIPKWQYDKYMRNAI